MTMLKRLLTSEVNRLEGYLDAAQHMFVMGQIDVTLEAALFEMDGDNVLDEDLIHAAYPDGFNPIEYRAECSFDDMVSGVHKILKITRQFWKQEYSVPEMIESNLREGYWQHVKECFDHTNARIVELGHDVPFVKFGVALLYFVCSRYEQVFALNCKHLRLMPAAQQSLAHG
jgi:hypothetical protein